MCSRLYDLCGLYYSIFSRKTENYCNFTQNICIGILFSNQFCFDNTFDHFRIPSFKNFDFNSKKCPQLNLLNLAINLQVSMKNLFNFITHLLIQQRLKCPWIIFKFYNYHYLNYFWFKLLLSQLFGQAYVNFLVTYSFFLLGANSRLPAYFEFFLLFII